MGQVRDYSETLFAAELFCRARVPQSCTSSQMAAVLEIARIGQRGQHGTRREFSNSRAHFLPSCQRALPNISASGDC
jgi:hypothetical protein